MIKVVQSVLDGEEGGGRGEGIKCPEGRREEESGRGDNKLITHSPRTQGSPPNVSGGKGRKTQLDSEINLFLIFQFL